MVISSWSATRVAASFVFSAFAFASLGSSVRAAVPFTEEAGVRGLVYTTITQPAPGVGVAFVDLDSDGDPDVVAIGNAGGTVGLFENLGDGTFVDRSLGSGIPPLAGASAICAGDYDGDGKLDLYFSNWLAPNFLCHNEGGFSFVNVAVAAGVDDAGFGMGSTWGDYDGDGWLDLYVANRSVPDLGLPTSDNRLYRNRGDGTFEDVAVTLGVDLAGADSLSNQASFVDFDNDGDADLYVGTDKGASTPLKNHLFKNMGGTFVDISVSSGADISLDTMSITIGDLDGNGYQDIFCTNSPPGHLLIMNNGNETFTESSVVAGVHTNTVGWGAAFFDYDNDGFLDLYVNDLLAGNQLHEYKGSFPCTETGAAMGVNDPGRSFGMAIADIDGDGDIDLLVQDNDEPLKLYINHEGELRNWIKFDVLGQDRNLFAIGAQVLVRTGAIWQLREVFAGANTYKGQNELTLHFGLGTATSVDEVVVTWPGGHTQTLTNLAVNRAYLLNPLGNVPTLSEWGLVIMSMGLFVLGTLVLRARSGYQARIVRH